VVDYSFPVRLFHSQLHAGLSRRYPELPSAPSSLPDSDNFGEAWSTTGESLLVKGGALAIGYLAGGTVRTAAVFLAEDALPLAATGLTATATVMDLRARLACGQGF